MLNCKESVMSIMLNLGHVRDCRVLFCFFVGSSFNMQYDAVLYRPQSLSFDEISAIGTAFISHLPPSSYLAGIA